jgi:tRNA A-37 threonylcarbamoyl transferase component Bud32
MNGQKVMVKQNKRTKLFHEFLLVYAYSLFSILLFHPSSPPTLSEINRNEGDETRNKLKEIGIPTPRLFSMSDGKLVEEYVEGGDLYLVLGSGSNTMLAYQAGSITAKLHNAGYSFIDNKAQNYLVRGNSIIRTDLGFMKQNCSLYSKSIDIGSFLASVMDLDNYNEIFKSFHAGYLAESGSNFSYLSIIIRNILSVGFSSTVRIMLKNMVLDARESIGI